MTRCLKPLLEPRLLTFSRREFADSTCRPRFFFFFFFLRKSPVTSVRTINMMIEDTQQMKMKKMKKASVGAVDNSSLILFSACD